MSLLLFLKGLLPPGLIIGKGLKRTPYLMRRRLV